MALMAKCTKCGNVDDRQTYASVDDAAKQGVFERWTCQVCAWTENELVEAEAAQASAKS